MKRCRALCPTIQSFSVALMGTLCSPMRRAMRLAGVNAATKDPAGGRIIRLPNGDPSGVFIDNAQSLVRRAVPSMSDATLREATLTAIAEVNKWGMTGLHDAGELEM
jgi:predicted amidohydrolase YtcJ